MGYIQLVRLTDPNPFLEHIFGLQLVSWSHLLIFPWPCGALGRYIRHNFPSDGHKGIYKFLTAISDSST